MNATLLEEISNVSKKNAKVLLLEGADDQMRRLITMAVDQNTTFGVTVDEDEQVARWKKGHVKTKVFWDVFETLLVQLSKRDVTGNTALNQVDDCLIAAPSDVDLKWACRIINRNLRAGFDRSTCNKAWGKNTVKKFEVQLADTYGDQVLEGEWIFEPKLNGNRVVGYKGQPTSRGNKIYPSAQPIFEKLRGIKGFLDKWVPDGEMMGNLGFDKSSGALRRSSGKGEKADFTYWLFDMFTAEEYESQSTATLRERKTRLDAFFLKWGHDLPNVKPVPWFVVKNPTHKQIMKITEDFVKNGFEGAMAKRLDSKAVFKRGPDLLKIKLFYEDDFKVVDFYEGKNNIKGTLGGFWVEGTIKWGHTGKPQLVRKIRSKVGSGFKLKFNADEPDAVLRDDVWKNKKNWLGAVVQVQFQEATKDGSLQFPVFVMRRRDKED